MHPESRPHRLLTGDLRALQIDRLVLAAARKYRRIEAEQDLSKPGEFGIAAILKLLARGHIQGG